MSFSAEVKEELVHVEPLCSHCNDAMLSALLHIEGTLLISGGGCRSLEIATDFGGIARVIIRLLREGHRLETRLTIRRSVLHKTVNYLIELPAQPGFDEALKSLGILSAADGIELGIKPELVEKQCCAASYLRGAFLGSGFVADPQGDFHFEIVVNNETLACDLVSLLAAKGIDAKIASRRSSSVVYLKSGSSILEFLAFAGAHRCALRMENERVVKSVRNEVNRMTNAEVANQAKASSAAFDQLMAIQTVVEAYGMDGLPPALRDFIMLRVSHQDLSLRELGRCATPPLSKSAVYHRVRRIEQLAAEIKG